MVLALNITSQYVIGNKRQHLVEVDFDSSYPTGGEPLTKANLGLSGVERVTAEPKSGYLFEYDYTNEKLKAFEKHSVYSVAIDPPSIAAGAIADVAVAVTGVATADRIIAIPPVDLEEDLILQNAWVSATDEIKVRLQNVKTLGNTRMYSVAIDPASIAADASLNVVVAVTGVTTADRILEFPPTGIENGLVVKAVWASAANEITIRIQNTTAAAVDGASLTWNFMAVPEPAAIDGASKTWKFIVYRDQEREVKNATDLSGVTKVKIVATGY